MVLSTFVFVSLLILTRDLHASEISNKTEHLMLEVGNKSFNPFTLTFSAEDICFQEFDPPRKILSLGKGEISIGLLRLLFMRDYYVDCFQVDDLYVSFLRDSTGVFHFINPAISSNEIARIKSAIDSGDRNKEANKNRKKDGDKGDRKNKPTHIPDISFNNINFEIFDLDSREALFSLDNMAIQINDIEFPLTNNMDVSSFNFYIGLNKKTNQYFKVDLAARTALADPFFKIYVEAHNIELKTIRQFEMFDVDVDTNNTDKVLERIDPVELLVAGSVFSNEWRSVNRVIESEMATLKTNKYFLSFLGMPTATNMSYQELLEANVVSNVSFDFALDLSVSNSVFQPGEFNLTVYNDLLHSNSMSLRFAITNTPEIFVPWNGLVWEP